MNFQACRRILEVSLDRDDLRDLYPDWINRALRSIQADYNYNCMRHEELVEMPSGATTVSLPTDFKELTPARPPIFVRAEDIATSNSWLPCDVRRKEEVLRSDAALLLPRRLYAHSLRGPDVWLSTDGGRWFLNILDVAVGSIVFRVSYFRFLPKLMVDEDENDLTRSYEELVSHKIKAVGFAEISDPAASAFETLYEVKKMKAQGDDARRWLAGRRLQMGG